MPKEIVTSGGIIIPIEQGAGYAGVKNYQMQKYAPTHGEVVSVGDKTNGILVGDVVMFHFTTEETCKQQGRTEYDGIGAENAQQRRAHRQHAKQEQGDQAITDLRIPHPGPPLVPGRGRLPAAMLEIAPLGGRYPASYAPSGSAPEPQSDCLVSSQSRVLP